MTLTVFLLALGATARLTRAITDDYIAGWARAIPLRKWGPDHWVSYWVHCPWCVSPYVGAGVFTTAWFYSNQSWWVILSAVLTASWLIGIAASWLDGDRA